MSDLDEDLLALAGAGGEDDSGPSSSTSRKRAPPSKRRAAPAKKKRRAIDSDEDDLGSPAGDFEEDEEDESDGPDMSRSNRRKNDEDDDEDDDDDLGEEFVNPYPLQGKYKDENDMHRLEAMTEIEREQILFDRSQEMQEYNERKYLAQRLKQSKKDKSAPTRSSTRDTPKGSSSKRSQLSELKKKREEKSDRVRQRSGDKSYSKLRYDEDEDEEDEEEEEDDEWRSGDDERAEDDLVWADSGKKKSEAPRELTVEDLNRIRIGRTLFAKYCHYPEFDRTAAECFVRVNISNSQVSAYRVCQIKSVVESKSYQFLNRTVNTSLLVTHASAEKLFEMSVCSDKPFSEDEFQTWKKAMKRDGLALPSKRLLDHKFDQLHAMRERVLTAEEVNAMIDLRQKLTANKPTNAVLQKTLLSQNRAVALAKGDLEEVASIDAKIAAIDSQQESKLSSTLDDSQLQKLSKVNERNRRANQDEIRRAEIRKHEERRRALASKSSAVTSDPFSRLKTNPRMYLDSTVSDTGNVEEQGKADIAAAEAEEEENAKEAKSKQRLAEKLAKQPLSAIDDLLAKTEFGVDIEFDL
ncbi:hypothetical protein BZA70DRAFT_154180 [Myxozyma melibiosi]|uniref:Plus3 domain-containing protein n=1 Tax=Myxozyma melibiosi TaxID=54550 RepID=A0ABR1F693_9ASCO